MEGCCIFSILELFLSKQNMPITKTHTDTWDNRGLSSHAKTSLAFATDSKVDMSGKLKATQLILLWPPPDPVAQQHTYLHLWGEGSSYDFLVISGKVHKEEKIIW